jgi:hypothetical protein
LERRPELERELQTLIEDIESKQHALELVEATERQLIASQGRGQPDLEGNAPGASTQVRGWVNTV